MVDARVSGGCGTVSGCLLKVGHPVEPLGADTGIKSAGNTTDKKLLGLAYLHIRATHEGGKVLIHLGHRSGPVARREGERGSTEKDHQEVFGFTCTPRLLGLEKRDVVSRVK